MSEQIPAFPAVPCKADVFLGKTRFTELAALTVPGRQAWKRRVSLSTGEKSCTFLAQQTAETDAWDTDPAIRRSGGLFAPFPR